MPGYQENTLVTSSSLRSDKLRLQIICEDTVDPLQNLLLRSLRIRSMDGVARTVRCFFHHDFYLYGDKQRELAGNANPPAPGGGQVKPEAAPKAAEK